MQEIKCPKCGELFQVDESGYAAIVKQVRDKEFGAELAQREAQFAKEKESAVRLATAQAEGGLKDALAQRDAALAQLRSEMEQRESAKALEALQAAQTKEQEIAALQAQLSAYEKEKELAVLHERAERDNRLAEKDRQILMLESEVQGAQRERTLGEKALQETYEEKLKMKDTEIAFYKDFKARQSTKMIGESLEQHCETEFNKLRATGFQRAYFEKDNDARSGSKGDYIYKEQDENGVEFISIMFEMKNEMDQTATKKKNEDFLKELDKDRREKGCEYAVLVSLLEPDSDFYNAGIVDMSHRYPKMYIIRPQCFIPMITLLRNASRNALQYRQELAQMKNQNIDISRFEDSMNDFKDKFSRNFRLASERFHDAIDEIDKTIDHLQKTKDALLSSEKHLRSANNKAEDLSIKRLTRGNPTMTEKFAALAAPAALAALADPAAPDAPAEP